MIGNFYFQIENSTHKIFHIGADAVVQSMIDLIEMPHAGLPTNGNCLIYEQDQWREWFKTYCYSVAAVSLIETQTLPFFKLLCFLCGESTFLNVSHIEKNIARLFLKYNLQLECYSRKICYENLNESYVSILKHVVQKILEIDPDLSELSDLIEENEVSISLRGGGKLGVHTPSRESNIDRDVSWKYNDRICFLNKEQTGESVARLIKIFNDVYRNKICICHKNNSIRIYDVMPYAIKTLASLPLQKIFYGTPGTGKSHKIDYMLLKDEDGNYFGLKRIDKGLKFRTTFHPDYDYAQFVGAYKPQSMHLNCRNVADQNKNTIVYDFAPQVFAKAYVKAWIEYLKVNTSENELCVTAAENADTGIDPPEPQKNLVYEPKKVYLVIEEINRGNCAQIFGDIFQLLDRKNGHSEYTVDVDADFAEYIRIQLSNVTQNNGSVFNYWESYKIQIQTWCCENIEGEESCDAFCKIALPPNLNILATMNTSDQSLFPMDSAFKRRFEWEYVPIKYEKDATCSQDWNADEFEIIVGTSKYKWLKFLYAVNKNVYEVTKSEDKEMGEFFIKPKKNNAIEFREFRSKVLFYLWDSVYKDEEGNSDAEKVFYFKNGEKPVTFQMLFEGSESDQQNLVNRIMQNLGIPVVPQESNSEELDEEAPAEGNVAQVDGGEATAQHENLVSENAVLEDAEELNVDHQEGQP